MKTTIITQALRYRVYSFTPPEKNRIFLKHKANILNYI